MAPTEPSSCFAHHVSQAGRPHSSSMATLASSSTSGSTSGANLTNSPAPTNSTMPTSKSTKKGKGKKFVPLDIWGTSTPSDMTSTEERNPTNSSGFRSNSFSRPQYQSNGDQRQDPQDFPRSKRNGLGSSDMSQQMRNLSLAPKVKKLPSGPLKKFLKFPKLPVEIRLKVWCLICNMPRLLEVSFDFVGQSGDGKNQGAHYYYRLAGRSCLPPALMHVNQEAREEAKRYYQEAIFTTRPTRLNSYSEYPACEAFKTWYNPSADVLVFAENTCMNTLVRLFEDQRIRNTQINRVAILLSGTVFNCHGWNHDDPIHGTDQYSVDLGYDIAGGCTAMQALHGIHRSVALTSRASGVKGLKEVFFLVPTYLTPIKPGSIDDSIWFRAACSDGMTTGQVAIKKSIEAEVHLVRCGTPLPYCGPLDNWTRTQPITSDEEVNNHEQSGSDEQTNIVEFNENESGGPGEPSDEEPSSGTMRTSAFDQRHNERIIDNEPPTFRFVSFTPAANAGDIFDAITIRDADIPKINYRDWAFMKKVEHEANVHLKVPEQDYGRQVLREIGFYGKAEGIAKAKHMIMDRLDSMSDKTWHQKMSIRKQDYRGTSKVDYFGAGEARTTAAAEY